MRAIRKAQRHRSGLVIDARLWCRKSPEDLEVVPRIRNSTTGKLPFGSVKDKAAKEEGWAPPFICCAHDIVGL